MSKKIKTVVVRMEDPKAKAKPDLSYGGSSLSVEVDEDDRGFPLRLRVHCEIDLPEATVARKLHQDLLAATQVAGQAAKYLSAREGFFKEQICIRLQTKGCKQEPGFLRGELIEQNKQDWDWKEFAIQTLAKSIRKEQKISAKRARVLAEAQAKAQYDKAPVKTHNKNGTPVKPSVQVKGVE